MDEHENIRTETEPEKAAPVEIEIVADADEIQRDDGGRVADSASASALARRRWDGLREAYAQGAIQGARVSDESGVVAKIARVTARRAVDPADPKQLDAAREVMDRLLRGEQDGDGSMSVTAKIPVEAIPLLAEALASARAMRAKGD